MQDFIKNLELDYTILRLFDFSSARFQRKKLLGLFLIKLLTSTSTSRQSQINMKF